MMQLVVFVQKMTILHTGSKCKDQIKELNNIYCGEFVIICQECTCEVYMSFKTCS